VEGVRRGNVDDIERITTRCQHLAIVLERLGRRCAGCRADVDQPLARGRDRIGESDEFDLGHACPAGGIFGRFQPGADDAEAQFLNHEKSSRNSLCKRLHKAITTGKL